MRTFFSLVDRRNRAVQVCDQAGFLKHTKDAIRENKLLLKLLNEIAAAAVEFGNSATLAEARNKITDVAGALAGFELNVLASNQ